MKNYNKKLFFILIGLFLVCYSTYAQDFTKSFNVKPDGTFIITTCVGDVNITTSNNSTVNVTAKGIIKEEMNELKVTQEGNNIEVYFKPDRCNSKRVKYEIQIPEQYNAEITTSGGNINLSGKLNGMIKGKTAGGNIKLGTIGGKVDMKTSGGDISVESVGGEGKVTTAGGNIKLGPLAGDFQATTSGGNITIENSKKNLKASTAGGNIKVGDIGGEAKVSTSGGDIQMANVNGEVKASTAGGNINVGKASGKATLSTAGGDINLDGAKDHVKASTAGGNISLKDIYGSCVAKTAGGDISVELTPSGNGKSEMSTAGGEITLSIPENSNATIEAVIGVDKKSQLEDYTIRSEFNSTTYEKSVDDKEIRAKYVVNNGGELITLKTVNSNINIKKLKK